MLCGKSEVAMDAEGYTLGGAPLIGSDPNEASRRRYFFSVNSGILIGMFVGTLSLL